MVQLNCCIPAYVEGDIHYRGTPEFKAEYALFARAVVAKIMGGRCGTGPAHVAAIVAALEEDWVDVNIDNSGGDNRRKWHGGRRVTGVYFVIRSSHPTVFLPQALVVEVQLLRNDNYCQNLGYLS